MLPPRFNWVTRVWQFHDKFGLGNPNGPEPFLSDPQVPEPDVLMARSEAMMEEVLEFMQAARARDLPGMADALIDLIYFACGTLLVLGIGDILADTLFEEVHRANMGKEAVDGDGRSGNKTKRMTKPSNWRPPQIARILEAPRWRNTGGEPHESA